MSAYPTELTQRWVARPGEGWVGPGEPAADPIIVTDPDPTWPEQFSQEADRIRAALASPTHRG